MLSWGKWAFAVAMPLMLASCLWGPGKFTSDLALRKDGRFVLDYRGEILLQMPDETNGGPRPGPWAQSMARCYADGRTETSVEAVPVGLATADGAQATDDDATRPCTPGELAKLKTDYEKQAIEKAELKRKEADQTAKMLGLPGSDDESNRRFAANMMKYQGWRSVRYVGKGVFDVDYHFEGRVGQDFVFPMMPDSDLIVPFVMIRRRNDGSVMVTAPMLTGATGPFGARAKALGMPGSRDGPPSRALGVFSITTDGEILTNNSEDGPAAVPTGRRVKWEVAPGSTRVPEMLVRL